MANEIDLHVGKRLRRRRRLLGLTQQQLAEKVGIRFQQIQKYECGGNRVTASRLYELATALNVPVGYFYEGMPQSITVASPVPPANDRDLIAAACYRRRRRSNSSGLTTSSVIDRDAAFSTWPRLSKMRPPPKRANASEKDRQRIARCRSLLFQ